jgi:predicted transglutaminase-like cysteine proteinase
VLRVAFVLGFAASLAVPASARGVGTDISAPATMPIGPQVEAPYGFVDFCTRNPAPCRLHAAEITNIRLTPEHRATLERVNAKVNRLPQITDLDNYGVVEYWSYPNKRGGDCEDLALEKQRRLVALGFPEDALLLAVVRQANGEGHTVLVAETDRGEFVLDNLSSRILAWSDAPYTWRKRQSRRASGIWQSIDPIATRIAEASKLPARRDTTSAPLRSGTLR